MKQYQSESSFSIPQSNNTRQNSGVILIREFQYRKLYSQGGDRTTAQKEQDDQQQQKQYQTDDGATKAQMKTFIHQSEREKKFKISHFCSDQSSFQTRLYSTDYSQSSKNQFSKKGKFGQVPDFFSTQQYGPAILTKDELLSLIHISEPTRLGMISYAVFCLKKKKKCNETTIQ
eukprot:TRINITY_DN24051_c0_g1_i1.p1 TRINITY_DN24051_c0_g1~~TRINITY_DN24051_c0_g1_i1.p1  ORF type:complete len:174 (-),score=31.17 TRINITY_DN24051_c0_g1_i1:23-544(-)